MMAKAGLEAALWDLLAKADNVSLSRMLGGTRKKIDVGVSIGIQPSVDALIRKVEGYLAEGYRRIKIKIAPGDDLQYVEALRRRFPDLLLQVDANSAYRLEDIGIFRKMDGYGLLLIEQPLGYEDIYDHSKLQRELKTPICLDESIHSLDDTRAAIELDSCRVINIKPGRVGGFTESILIHDYCASRGIPVWHGGMLESGIGRAGNVALASLPNFTLPGDISASSRYYTEDIVEPAFYVNSDGTMDVPQNPELGSRSTGGVWIMSPSGWLPGKLVEQLFHRIIIVPFAISFTILKSGSSSSSPRRNLHGYILYSLVSKFLQDWM